LGVNSKKIIKQMVTSKKERYKQVSKKLQRYPFDQMELGDSFFVPLTDLAFAKRPGSTVINAASNYGRKYNMKFIQRKIFIGGEPSGFRIWRIE